MASTRKSQLILTCNAQAIKDVFDYLNKELGRIKLRRDALLRQYEGRMWTADAKREFKQLGDDIAAITSMQQKNEESMRKYGQVMQDLAGSKLREVKSAVREVTSALNKMSEKDPNRQKLIDDLAKLKNQLSVIGGSRRSLTEVTNDLKDLSNVRFDHLQQDLEAVRAKYAQLTTAQRQGSIGASLKNSESLLMAQMAVAQTPVSVTPVANLTAQQLRTEQSALNGAMAATNGIKGFEAYGAQAAARLKEVNEQLTILSEKEKQAAADARNLTKTQQASDVVLAIYRKQAVSLEELDATYKTLEARANKFAGVNPAKAKAAQQQMAAVAAEIKRIKATMQEEIRIDKDFLRNATNQQLQAALTQLQQKLQGLNSTQKKEADAIVADMKRVKNQIDQNTAAVNNQKSAWGALGTTLKNLTAYVGVFAMFNKLKGLFEDFISKNREFSDQLANVRKVSGLAMNDIKELANNLSKIDSRTSLEGLMELSYTGAKLGFGNYGIEGLESFARSAVKVQNALSEDMGADAMTALSKMVEVMGLIPKMGVERAMDATGSAIFKLASTSTATGTNIVEFSKRLMGLANIAHISTQDLLAFGSAADSMALAPEVAATAFNKFITAMQKQPNLIEDALHIDKGTISDLYQAGKMTDAMVLVFEKMREKGGMNALMQAGVFKDLGSDGARLVSVMATMANRVDMLNAHLAVSRQAFEEGTAVAQEYAIQMDTAQAYAERAANIWEKAFVNPEGVDVVKEFSKAWYEVSKSLTQNEKFMFSLKISLQGILLLLKGIMAILPELMAMLLSGGFGMLIANLRTSEGLLASLTSWFGKLTVAQKAFFKAAGWVGLALTIFEVGKAVYDLSTKIKEASDYMKGFDNTLSNLNLEFGKGEIEVRRYKKAIDEANMGTKQRMAAITNFNSKFGPYLKNLLTEKSTALDVANAYKEVTKALRAKLALQLKEKDINEQVLPREQWTADRRQEYEAAAKRAGKGQYGSGWITGYAQDNSSKSIDDMVREIGKKFYNIPDAVMKEVMVQARAGNKEFNNWGNIINSRYLNDANAILAANAYLRQDRSAQNAMNRVNKKWKPEQDAMDAYLAGQQKDEQYEPLTPAPDKGAAAAARKAAQERKQALRKEMEDAQKASTGIISKLEEYYRLQEAAIQEARADGQLTEDQAKEMVRALSIVKNESLATARRAVTTGNTEAWDEMKTKVLPSVLADTSDVSQNLLSTIQQVAVDKLHNDLQKFNGGKDVMGLDSRAFFDQMNAKAAGNTREAARLRAAITNEVEKALKQYHFVELAQDKMRKDLETMGFMTETYEQWAKRMQEGIKEKPDTQLPNGGTISDKDAYNKMGQKFVVQRDIAYRINIENEREALDWLQQFSKDAEGNMEDWTYAFPELQRWLDLIKTRDESLRKDDIVGARQAEKAIEESMPAIQQFYGNLMQYEGAYYDALKKRDDLQNKRLDSWWEHSDQKKENDQKLRDIQIYDFQYNTMHEGQGMGYMMGLTNDVSQDPEVLHEQAVLEAKIAIWKKAKEEREANQISEEVYQERLKAMQDQTMAYTQKVMDNINKRISRIQAFVKPVETAANTIGKKLGDMIFNMQSEESTWEQIWKNMALAMAESLLTMVGQYAQYQIQKSAINKSEVLDEAGKAQAITMLNISSGTAKTIGTLGWWGIALIPVITGLLMGLLTSALSTVNSSESGTSTSTPKTKLVSGMLTYDKGNVDRFAGRRLLYDDGTTQVYGRRRYLGEDGRVYTATEEPAPKDGLVTHPIATTVQGQPALVAERGPEIVIGRETTKAIMMNEPQLIKYLADYGKTGGFAGGYRPFDSGNINGQWSMVNGQSSMVNGQSSMVNGQSSMVNGQLSPDDARALVAAIGTFNQTVQQMQQKGIPCYINKYGRGGLIDEVKSGMKFMSKYEG